MVAEIRIATRKSLLALYQANFVANSLKSHYPDLEITLVPITTTGDKLLNASLVDVGGKGLFIKELEQAMLENTADIAVHSMKDLPAELDERFYLAAILKRDDPRDVLLSKKNYSLKNLPQYARIGTSSLRRQSVLKAYRADFDIQLMRGNIDTRINKLKSENYDAIVLAACGLQRLQIDYPYQEFLPIDFFIPAIGQGIIAVEIRQDDQQLKKLLTVLSDPDTKICATAERAFNARLQGGCRLPLAAHATLQNNKLHLQGMIGMPDGNKIIRGEKIDISQNAETIGMMLADELLARGGAEILQKIEKST